MKKKRTKSIYLSRDVLGSIPASCFLALVVLCQKWLTLLVDVHLSEDWRHFLSISQAFVRVKKRAIIHLNYIAFYREAKNNTNESLLNMSSRWTCSKFPPIYVDVDQTSLMVVTWIEHLFYLCKLHSLLD